MKLNTGFKRKVCESLASFLPEKVSIKITRKTTDGFCVAYYDGEEEVFVVESVTLREGDSVTLLDAVPCKFTFHD